MENIIILGGGIAGTAAAEEIRKRNTTVNITIIEEEQHPCYSRVLLPHYLKDKTPREKVFLKTSAWYVEKHIELMSGVRAVELDVRNRFVRTSEGRELHFDKLLIATGGEIGLFHDDLRGVSYLHSVDDADHAKALLRELQLLPIEDRHAAVYGGGFIALEYANFFQHFNIPFSIIMRGSGFWSKILSHHSQAVLAHHAEVHGVPLYTQQPMPQLIGEDELRAIKLHDGPELPVRMLGVGIGMQTDRGLLEKAGVPLAHGVLANEYLETTLEGVYTAGDVAEFTDVLVERQVRYGNWMNAQMQGRAVGATMTGTRTPFKLASSYATNLLGMHVVFLGDVSKEHADEVRAEVATDTVSQELLFRGGKLVGAILIGDVSARAKLTQAIGKTL